MSFTAPHVGFVIAAYLLTFVVLGGLIAVTVLSLRSRQRHLQRLESRLAERKKGGEPIENADRT